MLFFSSYLKKNGIDNNKLSNINTKKFHLYAWASELGMALNEANEYYPKAYDNLKSSIARMIHGFMQDDWGQAIDDEIKKVDDLALYFYGSVVDYAIAKSYKSPINSVLPYPYNKHHAGVSISAYVVDDSDKPSISGGFVWESSGYVALKDKIDSTEMHSIKRNIIHALSTSKLSNASKTLILERVRGNKFHAEDYWFAIELPKLLNYLERQFKKSELLAKTNDELWLQQLKTTPRIEFVMTSSPCDRCQTLFKDMRHIFNELKLGVPILIFANSLTNNDEVIDVYSRLAIIGFNRSYFNTKLITNMPNTVSRSGNADFIRMHGLFHKKTQVFNRLESVMNQIMPKMLTTSQSMKNLFIDDLFQFFAQCFVLNKATLAWFIHFLQRLPHDFDTSKEMSFFQPVPVLKDGVTEVGYPIMVKKMLPDTKVRTFLSNLSESNIRSNRINFFETGGFSGNQNRTPNTIEFIEKKLVSQVEPYHTLRVMDFCRRNLDEFYFQEAVKEADEAPRDSVTLS